MAKQNQYYPDVVFHPGATLAEKLEELGMGPKEFAIRTGKPEKTISAILSGESSITADMAVQFENVTRIPAHFWMNYQRAYDEYIARIKRQEALEQAAGWVKSFPVSQMMKFGWLEKLSSGIERTAGLFEFFGVSNAEAWENYYCNQQLKVAFRISLKHTRDPFALSVWLRKGELEASTIEAPIYSETKFRELLPDIKSLAAEQPEDFFQQLQEICLAAGVKVVHVPPLPKAPVTGATRWINDHPLIQLSGRGRRNDIFWFSFFHEAGHILHHGKKEIFLEDIEYDDKDMIKEEEADAFAVKWTFSEGEERELKQMLPLTEQEFIQYAARINTHPSLIIGRLQHNKDIPYYFDTRFFKSLVFPGDPEK